ncbi:MAG: acetoacetate decarboxylase family protein [Solirubrobacterales bacterium]
MPNEVKTFPAPWKLRGHGYVLVYRFDRSFAVNQTFLTPEHARRFAGGLGAVMLVRYDQSDAGPYDELLMMPGKLAFGSRRWHTISKIYVSTRESVVNGRLNWAIPKELAQFDFAQDGPNRESVTVTVDEEPVLESRMERFGIPFPVYTRLLPFPLIQEQPGGRLLETVFSGYGIGRLVRIKRLAVNPERFPDISRVKPLLAIRIDGFRMTFPVAKEIRTANVT